ncbi:MAG: TonB C-terminal domain-containing protein [Deltaproteobacteria bacterium]|jgi:outer membrane biosynthesis protein TonB|nr:TonB C-terminal domain-containing protein [Deltaproteobacteria bacterium]
MVFDANRYSSNDTALEKHFIPFLMLSALLHALVLTGAIFLPGYFDLWSNRDVPLNVMTVQLLGALEPPAPAAPAAPVDPDLKGPDVVELPKTEPLLPQPTPLERMITNQPPPEVIPIGEKPPETMPEPVLKNPEPPPRVKPPDKTPPPEQVKPKTPPKTQNPEAAYNKRLEELRRKNEAAQADADINAAIGNIALRAGQSNGTSSIPSGSPNAGALLDPIKTAYYTQIRDIVRSNWIAPATAMSPDIQATYVIVIQPNGTISGKRLHKESGNPEFDKSVEQAISRSTFPPLPDVFQNKSDNPALVFQYNYLRSAGRS